MYGFAKSHPEGLASRTKLRLLSERPSQAQGPQSSARRRSTRNPLPSSDKSAGRILKCTKDGALSSSPRASPPSPACTRHDVPHRGRVYPGCCGGKYNIARFLCGAEFAKKRHLALTVLFVGHGGKGSVVDPHALVLRRRLLHHRALRRAGLVAIRRPRRRAVTHAPLLVLLVSGTLNLGTGSFGLSLHQNLHLRIASCASSLRSRFAVF